MWPLIYQVKVSATRSVTNQIKDTYKIFYMSNILNYDQICEIQIGFTIFLRNTYSHLAEHQCSAEHCLGNAGVDACLDGLKHWPYLSK
jgi:hypothetical protein